MHVTFKYDPKKEQFPLQVGMGGQNNPTKTKLALRSIDDEIDYLDQTAVAQWVTKIAQDDGLQLENDVERMSKVWQLVEPEASVRLAQMFATDWDPGNVTAFLTLSGRCPYNYPTHFWITHTSKRPIAASLHEIQHFYAHHLIQPLFVKAEKGNSFNDFKESLTVLLNDEFMGIMEKDDPGYPQHQDLRRQILTRFKAGDLIETIAKWYLSK